MSGQFKLDGIVPWGRTRDEYTRMFALADLPKSARVVDCGGGPASFTAERRSTDAFTVAADPFYAALAGAIREAFDRTVPAMLEGMHAARDRFLWGEYQNPEGVVLRRRKALDRFLPDLGAGDRTGGYVAAGLPHLPFADDSFDLALSSHLLFLYSADLDAAWHRLALAEMLRVAREVRVFPLLDLEGKRSPHLAPILGDLPARFHAEVRRVGYEFQAGGNELLVVTRAAG